MSLGVDGEVQLPGGAVPFGVGSSPAISRAGGLAPACDRALELAVEPHAPDGGTPFEQAFALPPAGPINGCVVSDLGALEAGGGPDLLFGTEAMLDGQLACSHRPAPRERQDPERRSLRAPGPGLPDEPLADPRVHGTPGGVGMAAEVGLGQVPE